jgi:2-oxo-4-hydroxy-4-carboxy-5-ureidoimidazoline decarboxylase
VTIDEINEVSDAAFVTTLGAIYEHSPWIAERAAGVRPFASMAALEAGLAKVVDEASIQEQIGLIAAHPDLGGRLARAGALEPSSAEEQASLGLDRLSDTDFDIFDSYNTRYRARFGFPFVIAVRRHTRNSVLAAFAARLQNDANTERRAALAEINMIARFRLRALFGHASSD